MWRLSALILVIAMLITLMPLHVDSAHAQNDDPLVTVSIAESEVEPGDTITVTWEASSHLRRFHHVTIELNHLVVSERVTLTSATRSGSIEMTVPDTYYDFATVRVYPEKPNNQRYKDATNMTIFAEAEVGVDDGVEVVSFTISPNPVERGQPITVSWEVVSANGPAPDVALMYDGEGDFYETAGPFPPVGSTTLEIPHYYTEGYSVTLMAPMTMGARASTTLICPFETALTNHCPIEQNTIALTYQYFEGGIMLQWEDSVFVLRTNPRYAGLLTVKAGFVNGTTPPDGLFLPAPAFAGIWLDFQDVFGFALGEPATYETLLETHPGYSGRHKTELYWLELPDGTLISVNITSFGWSFVED
ncbi:MAG: hypothetical protein K8L91_01210 [Anaerolineae bacterium]|nr:hypothetical protein [Anaerolineae bacterium]